MPLVAEEKVVFGLNSKAMSQLTLAKIRKVYSRADNKSIAKQVYIIIFILYFLYVFIKLLLLLDSLVCHHMKMLLLLEFFIIQQDI